MGVRPWHVRVWRVNLDRATEPNREILSNDEMLRADGFVHDRDRNRFIVARSALRKILGRELGIAPTTVRFCYGQHGKPRLENLPEQPAFNLSRSDGQALIAVGGGYPLGIDIELCKPIAELSAIASSHFTEAERLLIEGADSEMLGLAAFYRIWNRKEAVLKALGTGLSLQPKQVSVVSRNGTPQVQIAGESCNTGWWLADLQVGEPYCAALAVKGDPPAEVNIELIEDAN